MLFDDFYLKMMRNENEPPHLKPLRCVVECGLQSILMFLFAVIAVSSPLLGLIVLVGYPASIMFVTVRHGVRASLYSCLLAFAAQAALLNPFIGLQLFLLTAPVGIFLGYGAKKKWSFSRLILFGVIVAISSIVVTVAVLSCFFVDIAAPIQSFVFFPTFEQFSLEGLDLANETEFKEAILRSLYVGWPLFLVVGALMMTLPAIMYSNRLLVKLGEDINEVTIERIENFRFPVGVSAAGVIGFLMFYTGLTIKNGLIYQIGVNTVYICSVLYLFGGICFFLWFCRRRGLSFFQKLLLFFALLSFVVSALIIPFLGFLDPLLDLRGKIPQKLLVLKQK